MKISLLTWNIQHESTRKEIVPNRIAQIAEFLAACNADIICLQEVDRANFPLDFAALLTKYQFVAHTPNKKSPLYGNATLWKSELCEMVQSVQGSRAIHVALKTRGAASTEFVLSNIHMPAKPGLDGYREKLFQLAAFRKVWRDETVVVAGDFNDSLTNPFGLSGDFRDCGFHTPISEKHTCFSQRSGQWHDLDHVISNQFAIQYFPSLELSPLSDHLPVVARLNAFKT